MAKKPVQFKVPEQPKPLELRLGDGQGMRLDGGVSYKYIESLIRDNQSPFMQNLNADDRGGLTSRFGYVKLYATTLGAGQLHAITYYKGKKVLHHGTTLYTQTGTAQPVSIMTGLANTKGTFLEFNGILYYLNGTNYVQWNDVTATNVVGYIPTLTLGRSPTGGGTIFEQFNLLQPGFKDSFSADGTATVYTLSLGNLDATTVTATVGGVAKTEGVDFTVDRALGKATFTSAPAAGSNNVVTTAYKTNAGFADRVRNCKYAIAYGGTNDTRVFISGNPNYPNQYWISGLYDPTYFPENGYNRVGSSEKAVTGFIKRYDKLIVYKEASIYSVKYSLTSSGTATFPVEQVNASKGCDMPWTIQLIDNVPVFAHTQLGVCILTSTLIDNEKNVVPISGNINGAIYRPGLLDEAKADLLNASSVDFQGKYYICVGSKVWVWDYRLSPFAGDDELLSWFPYTNINANCWLVIDKDLYWGDQSEGLTQKATPEIYNDNGVAINKVWKSKLWNFGMPDFLKDIMEAWFSTRATSYTIITPKYYTDVGTIDPGGDTVKKVGSFSWSIFAWDKFSWFVSQFTPTEHLKPKVKKTIHFQIEFSNNELNQNLSILSLVVKYLVNRKVK